jgi:hypothetical protein
MGQAGFFEKPIKAQAREPLAEGKNEKNYQVTMMGEIFRLSKTALIWLK